jgi:hypothetical protein
MSKQPGLQTRVVLLTIGALAVAGFIASCNGGDDEAPNGTPGSPTATPAVTAPPGSGDFGELAAKYASGVEGMVRYKVDSENFGTHPQGIWTVYRLGQEEREDWKTNIYGYDETAQAFVVAEGLFLCSLTDFAQSCSIAEDIAQLAIVRVIFTEIKILPGDLLTGDVDYTATELPAETLGGVVARCFDVAVDGRIGEGPPGTEQIKLCFSPDGQLLAYDRLVTFTSAAPDARLTAIAEESRAATDADFETPVTPQDNNPNN